MVAGRRSQLLLSLLVYLILSDPATSTLMCFCINTPGTPLCNSDGFSCVSSTMCYTRRSITEGVISNEYGCLEHLDPGHFPSHFLDQVCLISNPTNVYHCCNDTNYCNNVTLVFPVAETVLPTPSVLSTSASSMGTGTGDPDQTHIYLGLIVGLPIASVVILILILVPVIIVILRCRKKRREANRRPDTDLNKDMSSLSYELGPIVDLDELTCTSGSGSGLPFLIQRTVAKSIKVGESIGNGRYGQVFVGWYQGEKVAVKKFASRDEHSWCRETEIYNTVLLRHDNILGFFASDMVSNNGVTELWLITQFHPNGSLYDYINMEALSPNIMMQMAISTCSGLAHLHTELFGTQAKPAIAHRDIKTKNILVKNNLTCCIADFGLAVMKEPGSGGVNIPTNPKQGTKRYMAPEILSETLNVNYFESFKQVDIYALGLVLWEICRRCTGSTGEADDYELPFQGLVPPDPSFDDMWKLVVVEMRQPVIPDRWHSDDLLQELLKTMRECWYLNSSARPTAVYLKKRLLKLSEEDKLDYHK